MLASFLEARVPAAPVNDVAALFADPHVQARDDLVTIDGLTMVAPAPRLRGTPGVIRGPGPDLGAHNDEVYAGWLGVSADELTDLRARGVV